MEYQILKPKELHRQHRTHYGTLHYDGENLKLNLIVTHFGRQRKVATGLFFLIADVLEKYYDIVKPVVNKGSISTGSSLTQKDRYIRNKFESNDLYQMILNENPDLKKQVEKLKRMNKNYKKKYVEVRKRENRGIKFADYSGE